MLRIYLLGDSQSHQVGNQDQLPHCSSSFWKFCLWDSVQVLGLQGNISPKDLLFPVGNSGHRDKRPPYEVFISCGGHTWNPTVHCHQWVLSCQVLGPSVYDPPRLNSELWKVCGFVDCMHGCLWVSNSLLAVRTLKGPRLYISARYMGSHCLHTCRHMCAFTQRRGKKGKGWWEREVPVSDWRYNHGLKAPKYLFSLLGKTINIPVIAKQSSMCGSGVLPP